MASRSCWEAFDQFYLLRSSANRSMPRDGAWTRAMVETGQRAKGGASPGRPTWRIQEGTAAGARKWFPGRPCPPTMSSRDSQRIPGKPNGIVTALSVWTKIHTFLHHERCPWARRMSFNMKKDTFRRKDCETESSPRARATSGGDQGGLVAAALEPAQGPPTPVAAEDGTGKDREPAWRRASPRPGRGCPRRFRGRPAHRPVTSPPQKDGPRREDGPGAWAMGVRRSPVPTTPASFLASIQRG